MITIIIAVIIGIVMMIADCYIIVFTVVIVLPCLLVINTMLRFTPYFLHCSGIRAYGGAMGGGCILFASSAGVAIEPASGPGKIDL